MRRFLAVIFTMCITATAFWGQQASLQKASPAELLKQLNSDEPVLRNDALEELRSNPDALQDPKIKIALIGLMDKENHKKFFEDDEGYAEYVAWLAETTAKVVDWTDQRQVCILADGVYLEDELADHAKASLPCLLKRFNNSQDAFRGRVIDMIVQALNKGKSKLDSATIESTQKTIRGALHDTDEHVRADTVRALGKFGGPEMILALEEVAKTDKATDKLDNSLWIREYAVSAIAEIQNRAGQKQ